MTEEHSLIVVSQLPVIQEQLRLLRESWEQKAAQAASMICTEETVQSLKEMRAEMRKEFQEADTQRKAAKEKYMAPWNAVEVVFKDCVKDAFTRADESLKQTITGFEDELKKKCYEDLQRFFAEHVQMENIDFLTLDQAMALGGIRISLSDAKKNTPRQLQDAVASVVAKVAIGMEQIATMDDSAEIMAEYKQCFDVGKAVAVVQGRKRRVEAEREAAEARRAAQERQKAAADKVDAVAPPVVAPPDHAAAPVPERVFEKYTFTVYNCTRSQLIRVREFLKQEGINYG